MENRKYQIRVKPLRDYVTDIKPKNALEIGFIGKNMYVVTLARIEQEGKYEYIKKIHTFLHENCDKIEYVEESLVDDFMKKLTFY